MAKHAKHTKHAAEDIEPLVNPLAPTPEELAARETAVLVRGRELDEREKKLTPAKERISFNELPTVDADGKPIKDLHRHCREHGIAVPCRKYKVTCSNGQPLDPQVVYANDESEAISAVVKAQGLTANSHKYQFRAVAV